MPPRGRIFAGAGAAGAGGVDVGVGGGPGANASYAARRVEYLVKKNSNPNRVRRNVIKRMEAGKKAAATRAARGIAPSAAQVAARQRFAAAIAQAKAQGAQPGQIKRAAVNILRAQKVANRPLPAVGGRLW